MDIVISLGFLLLTYLVGTKFVEGRHYKSIRKREQEYSSLPAFNMSESDDDKIEKCWLVSGSTVISIDSFKRFVANFINLFGGRIITYESLLDRAKRESILRVKEQAREGNADGILNLRIETSSISKSSNQNGDKSIGAVEILAYGTAFKVKP